jgi:hypothetical protein
MSGSCRPPASDWPRAMAGRGCRSRCRRMSRPLAGAARNAHAPDRLDRRERDLISPAGPGERSGIAVGPGGGREGSRRVIASLSATMALRLPPLPTASLTRSPVGCKRSVAELQTGCGQLGGTGLDEARPAVDRDDTSPEPCRRRPRERCVHPCAPTTPSKDTR